MDTTEIMLEAFYTAVCIWAYFVLFFLGYLILAGIISLIKAHTNKG